MSNNNAIYDAVYYNVMNPHHGQHVLFRPACLICAIHAQLNSFITRQMHGTADTRERKLLSHPCPSPSAPRRLLSVRPSVAATAEDNRCHLPPPSAQAASSSRPRPPNNCCIPRATQRHHPSERGSAPGDAPGARQEETCRIPA